MKRSKKRLIGAVLSLCSLAIAATAPMQASAASYGDINCDGAINLSDTVALNKYLAGMVVLNDYTIADLNQNNVIDVVDVLILQDFLTHRIPSLPYTG